MRLSTIILMLPALVILTGCSLFPSKDPQLSWNEIKIKAITIHEGFYEVSEDDLVGKGFPRESIRNKSIWLYQRGARIPFWFDEFKGKIKIRFFAPNSTSRYTDKQVTIITNGGQNNSVNSFQPNMNFRESNDFPEIADFQYIAINRLEENKLYQPQAETVEPWFWLSIPAPKKETIEFSLRDIQVNQGKIRLMVWASTESGKTPDHHIQLSINDKSIGDFYWDGKGVHLIDADIAKGILKDGNNTLTIYAPGSDEIVADIIWIDWLELSYIRDAIPVEDNIKLTSQGQRIRLAAFSGVVDIYSFTNSGIIRIDQDLKESSLWTGETGKNYWIVGPDGYRKPDRLEQIDDGRTTLFETTGADYIVISPDEFIEDLDRLVEHRRQQGLRGLVLPVSLLDNQFNYGFHEPMSIRNFLKWALKNWEISPRYVLLAGDSHYDYRGYQSPQNDVNIPAFFVSTMFGGETSSDVGYAELDGELALDDRTTESIRKMNLAVGRVPVTNRNQLNSYIDKVLQYEAQIDADSSQGEILAIAEHGDSTFSMNAESFLSLIGQSRKKEMVILPDDSEGEESLYFHDWGQNKEMIVYFGHGSINQWGRDKILTVDDLKDLPEMDKLPIVVEMTCLSGYFTHPTVQSISEVMLLEPGRGAIAIVAPTSLTLPMEQAVFSNSFAEQYNTGKYSRLGDVYVSAWNQTVVKTMNVDDLLNTYLFLGDPALLVPNHN